MGHHVTVVLRDGLWAARCHTCPEPIGGPYDTRLIEPGEAYARARADRAVHIAYPDGALRGMVPMTPPRGPVIEHVSTEGVDDPRASCVIDGVIIGPRSIARPEALRPTCPCSCGTCTNPAGPNGKSCTWCWFGGCDRDDDAPEDP